MPKKYTEARRTGEHVLSEANGARSREMGILAKGNLPAGAVLALLPNGDYVGLDPAAEDGSEVAKATLYAPTDASEEPQPIVAHVRACTVHREALTWPEGASEAVIAAGINDLVSRGVIVRD